LNDERQVEYVNTNIIIFVITGGGATRPLSRDGDAEELPGDPTVGPRPKVWTRGQKRKK